MIDADYPDYGLERGDVLADIADRDRKREKEDGGLNFSVWRTRHGWAAAVYEGDGKVPGSLKYGAASWPTEDAALADARTHGGVNRRPFTRGGAA